MSEGAIRPLAIVVFRRSDGCILAAPGTNPLKGETFYRPLGGGIEFGERAEEAARREILEELGAETHNLRLLGISENIFTFLGRPGHELVWVYEGDFTDPLFYEGDSLMADEGGNGFPVDWVHLSYFTEGKAPLYPDGLLEMLIEAAARVE